MEKHISEYYQIIEKAISTLGVDPVKTRRQAGRWSLAKGKNSVLLFVTPQKKDSSKYYFQVSAPILNTPKEDQSGSFERLLSLNSQLIGAAFVEFRGGIYISAIRNTKHISTREALLMINRIGSYSSFYNKHKEKDILDWPRYNPA